VGKISLSGNSRYGKITGVQHQVWVVQHHLWKLPATDDTSRVVALEFRNIPISVRHFIVMFLKSGTLRN